MTLLDMVQALWRESGTGGPKPATVVGAVGEAERLVRWIVRADLEIQQLHADWNFLWSQYSVNTVASETYLAAATNVANYDENAFFLEDQPICVAQYLDVKDTVRPTNEGRPWRVVIMPDKRLRLDPTPDQVYTLTTDFFTVPVQLAGDADVSVIPEAYHDAIVARALLLYANYENAPELMPQAQLMYESNLRALEAAWLPGHRDMHHQAEGNFFTIGVE